jgi:cyanuric acid amidohydrolase
VSRFCASGTDRHRATTLDEEEDDVHRIEVHRVPTAAPDDVTGLGRLIDDRALDPADIICVLGKTEGNGCVNDFSRGLATLAYTTLIAGCLAVAPSEVARRVLFIMSGGTEGVLCPHVTIFSRRETPESVAKPGKRLAAGIAHTRPFAAEEQGTMAMVRVVEDSVRSAMASAGITTAADVHFVQVKCPLLTADAIADAERRGRRTVTTNTYASMGYARAASALGVALALGEVPANAVTDEAIGRRWDLFSRVASTSSGVELDHCEVLVLGNAEGSASDLVIGHDVMEDAIDAAAVRRALAAAGVSTDPVSDAAARARLIGVFAKAEAAPGGRIRGRRHTMMDDSDINHTRHARAAVAAVIASVVGDPMVYVSGGAEHQGPSGGGPVAAIARAS